MGFVSLHTHSDHSLRDGFQTVEEMISYVTALGQNAVALTDHGTMSGCGEGFKYAKEYGIKFIAGCEHYLANDVTIKDKQVQHIVLLAMDKEGYRNLNILTTIAHSPENFYYRPRLDLALLRKYNAGIICTTACIAGCQSKAKELKEIFGDRLYIEIHTNTLSKQKKANLDWLDLAKKLDIKFYIAQDAHYTTMTQAEAQRSWTPYSFDDGGYEQCDDYYLHSEAEVYKALDYLPKEVVKEGIDRTQEVADRCDFVLPMGENHYPKSNYPSPRDEVRKRVWEGCKAHGFTHSTEHIEQIKHELDVLGKVDYFDYFLIVSDMINWCTKHNIRTGAGRGSVVGCDVAYMMGITKVDPLKYNLIFERFAHTERVTPADIDTDVPRSRRQDVIQHLKDEYGNVYQVVTFGRMANKSALKRAGQALNIDHEIIDNLCKDIETIDDLPQTKEVNGLMTGEYELLLKTAKKFRGKLQNYGTHASAVVVLTTDPYDYCAVEKFGDQYNLNYEFHDLEAMGLLKLDILGLETLDILDDTLKQIPPDQRPDLYNLPEDSAVYDTLNRGYTKGVFQLESRMMTGLIQKIKPESINDLIHIVALGRPAPLKAGITEEFINGKNRAKGPHAVSYTPYDVTGLVAETWVDEKTLSGICPQIDNLLKDTFGCIVYQEQVMKLVQLVFKMTLGEADMVRRAIGRKDPELMKKLIEDMKNRPRLDGISQSQAELILHTIEVCSGYLFNKSHSAAYAYTSYQTAYLKTMFPKEFYCALLNSNIDQEKTVEYLKEIENRHIKINYPNIIDSESKWTVSKDGLQVGLSTIRGVGNAKFTKPTTYNQAGFEQFLDENPNLNKQVSVNLVKAGAFDVSPLWGIDYIEWFKKSFSRRKEIESRLEKYKDNPKKVEEWKNKSKEIPDPPTYYDTSLDDKQKLQMEVLGMSNVDIFSMYDQTLCERNGKIKMCQINEPKFFISKKGKPTAIFDGKTRAGNQKFIVTFPDEAEMDKAKSLSANDMVLVKTYFDKLDGKDSGQRVFFCRDMAMAKKLA